jgi:hypothetical protein
MISKDVSAAASPSAIVSIRSLKMACTPVAVGFALLAGGAAAGAFGSGPDLGSFTNWTARTTPTTESLLGVAYGAGKFVAVGTKGTIIKSEGGGQWESVSSGFAGDLYCARYVKGAFVAGATNGVLVSSNGISWSYKAITTTEAGAGPTRITDVTYAFGSYVAAAMTVDGNRSMALFSSSDGAVWTRRYRRSIWSISQQYMNAGLALGGGICVAVGPADIAEATHRVLTSTNGIDWEPKGPTQESASVGLNQVGAATYGNSHHVAVGTIGPGPYAGVVFRSATGDSWQPQPLINMAVFTGIAFGLGRVVTVGSWALLVSADDGATWSGVDFQSGVWPPGWTYPNAVAFGNGTFVAVGYNGSVLQSALVAAVPPFFISTPTNQVVLRGTQVTLRTQAGGVEPLVYTWYKQGIPIGGNSTNLVLPNVQPADAGVYAVVVSSPYGSITNQITLTVSFVQIHAYAGLTIEGIPGRTYRVEYLNAWETGDQWHALTNLVLPASPYIWIDYQTPTVSRRYYRAAELP